VLSSCIDRASRHRAPVPFRVDFSTRSGATIISGYGERQLPFPTSAYHWKASNGDLPNIESAMLRVFDRSQDAARFLLAEHAPGAAREQLQQRRVTRVQSAFGHDVPRQLLGRTGPGGSRRASTVARASGPLAARDARQSFYSGSRCCVGRLRSFEVVARPDRTRRRSRSSTC
jgi:hypothetical protein